MKDNKKKYFELEIDIFALSAEDVITASSDLDVDDDPYDDWTGW